MAWASATCIPTGLSYQYDSGSISNCTGLLGACGWSTNFDERLTATATPGKFTYQDPSGNIYFVSTDSNGQMNGAPGSLQRVRYTIFDDNSMSWSSSPAYDRTNPPATGTYSTQINSGGEHYRSRQPLHLPSTGIKSSASRVGRPRARTTAVWDSTSSTRRPGTWAWFGILLGPTVLGMGGADVNTYLGASSSSWQSYSAWAFHDALNHLSLFGTSAARSDQFVRGEVSLRAGLRAG